jgi:hypothetical protein
MKNTSRIAEKKQKWIKLFLIRFLSDPDLYIETYWIGSETKELSKNGEWKAYKFTGRTTFQITTFKERNDNTTSKATAGTAKGTKATDRTVPCFCKRIPD